MLQHADKSAEHQACTVCRHNEQATVGRVQDPLRFSALSGDRSRTKDVILWKGWAIIHPAGLLMSPPACTHIIVVKDKQLQTLEAECAHATHGHESARRAMGQLASQRLSKVSNKNHIIEATLWKCLYHLVGAGASRLGSTLSPSSRHLLPV
jgi:hypothetical protein